MSQKLESVIAPSSVSIFQSLKLKRQGRSDARRYRGLQDFTRTHALIVAQSIARSGQRKVNQWVIETLDPIQTGNARILVQISATKAAHAEVKIEGEVSGRKRRVLTQKKLYLENQIINFQSQFDANISKTHSILLQGEQAIGSWVIFYEQMAGIYTRARAAKLKEDISSVQAEVPQLESVEIVNIQNSESSK